MRYVVTVNGEQHEVTVDGTAVRAGQLAADAHVAEVEGTPIHVVTIGTRVHRVLARRAGSAGRYILELDGFRFDAEALDERTRAIRTLAGSAAKVAGPAAVVAPMPGLVVRVLVQVGDTVHAGQGVVVIEAMKMENELRAPIAGVVRSVQVAAGSPVEKGAVLVEFEPTR